MSTQEDYTSWIKGYRASVNSTLGRCKEATAAMVKDFPELKIVPGHVYTDWGKRGHFWCETEDGTIIDPTADQFNVIWDYEAFEPGQEVRVGKCMNCGDEIWAAIQSLDEAPPPRSTCSDACHDAIVAEYNGWIAGDDY